MAKERTVMGDMMATKEPGLKRFLGDELFWALKSFSLFDARYIDFSSASIGAEMKFPGFEDKVRRMMPSVQESYAQTLINYGRERLAMMLNTSPQRISFTNTTTRSLDVALSAMGLGEKDEIITTDDEYGSVTYLMEQCLFGKPKVRKVRSEGDIVSSIKEAITKDTRAIVTSHVTHEKCTVLPVADISKLARSHGIAYLVDAAQSIGQMPVDIKEIKPTVLAGCGHKWLRVALTTGILYDDGSLKAIDDLWPESPFSFHPSRKERPVYESYGNTMQLMYLGMVMKQMEKLGWEEQYSRIAMLGNELRGRLRENPYVDMADSPNPAPGMVPFRVKGFSVEEIVDFLNVNYSLGTTDKGSVIRASVSPFNTLAEIEHLDKVLFSIGKHGLTTTEAVDFKRQLRGIFFEAGMDLSLNTGIFGSAFRNQINFLEKLAYNSVKY